MAGSKINNFSIGDSNIQSVMLTLDKAYKGLHQVSLTNYDNTSASQIAAGSVVENNGALYAFDSNESITGSPSNGTVYIRLVPSGDTITAEYTNTAPTWSDSKQGWYGTGGDANKRYLEFILYLDSTNWGKKIFNFNSKMGRRNGFVIANGASALGVGSSLVKAVITAEIDILSEISGDRFIAKNTGYYALSGSFLVPGVSTAGGLTLSYTKDGSLFPSLFSITGSSGGSFSFYRNIFLKQGEYLEFYYNTGAGITANFTQLRITIEEKNIL